MPEGRRKLRIQLNFNIILPVLTSMFFALSCLASSATQADVDHGSPFDDPGNRCIIAAKRAAHEFKVPTSVLIAITLAETGRTTQGEFRPWPWTTNVEGIGRWFEDREAAEKYIQKTHGDGKRSFDVGCFQINYKWHAKAFRTPISMLDPEASARYAAQFIKSLFVETGDWGLAAGYYHSRTPGLANKYRIRFERIRTARLNTDGSAPEMELSEEPKFEFPLLAGGGKSTPGSLFASSKVSNFRFGELMAPRGNLWDE